MGYDLHITRKDDWSDEEGPEISLAEWLALARADPEMRLDEYVEIRKGSESALQTDWVWTGYSQYDKTGLIARFRYRNGEVSVKNPDEEMIRKMWSVAQALSAKVQGDDSEVYDSSAKHSYPDWPERPWWKFW
jgi:hypothetical protein